jgi:hypothetical protein
MAPAFGNVKYSEFDGGDSIILGTTLLGAYDQLVARWGRAVQAYNSANPAVPITAPDSNVDPDASIKTSTFSLLAKKVYNDTTKKFDTEFATYVEPYTNWVTPTAGNLEGCTTMAEALYLVANAIKQCYDLLRPNLFVADPSGFASINDQTDGAIEVAVTYIVNEFFNALTGLPEYKTYNLLTLVDDQQGV